VDDGGQPEEEAEHDVHDDVDVAIAAVNEDGQGREKDAQNELDDLLHVHGHFAALLKER